MAKVAARMVAQRMLISACLALAACSGAAVGAWAAASAPGSAAPSPATVPPRLVPEAVAVTPAGVVWFDQDRIRLVERSGRIRQLRSIPARIRGGVYLSQSAGRWVALQTSHGLMVGTPGRLRLLHFPSPSVATRCVGWLAQANFLGRFFVLTRNRMVLDATGCRNHGGPQLIYVKAIGGSGPWRVLMKLGRNHNPRLLAAYGDLLAVGEQFSRAGASSRRMRVSVIDLRTDHLKQRFEAPDGYLQFADARRLVVSVPVPSRAPLQSGISPDGGWASDAGCDPCRMLLYSTHGRLIARLGTTSDPPLVSEDHLVSFDYSYQTTTETVSVRELPFGAPQLVRAFRAPGMTLATLSLRWPWLATVQIARQVVPPAHRYGCSGYGPPGPPYETTLNLARTVPSLPAAPQSFICYAPRH
jgi:hypothetical protein